MLKEGGVKLGDRFLQFLGLGHVVVRQRLVYLEVELGGKVERRPDGGVDSEGVVTQVGLSQIWGRINLVRSGTNLSVCHFLFSSVDPTQ